MLAGCSGVDVGCETFPQLPPVWLGTDNFPLHTILPGIFAPLRRIIHMRSFNPSRRCGCIHGWPSETRLAMTLAAAGANSLFLMASASLAARIQFSSYKPHCGTIACSLLAFMGAI